MIGKRNGKMPTVHPSAWVAPDATVAGDVVLGPECRVLDGARLIASGGTIEVGRCGVIMENAVLRSTRRHSLRIGDHCLVGPQAHVVGCRVDDQVFIATGAAVFHGAHLEHNTEVRVNGVVHLKTRLPAGETVPIGWVAVGDPATLLPPDRHDEIWAVQEPLNFPLEVYGFERGDADMVKITERVCMALKEASPE